MATTATISTNTPQTSHRTGCQGSAAALILPMRAILHVHPARASALVLDPVQTTARLPRRRKPEPSGLQVLPPHPTSRTYPARPPHHPGGVAVPWLPVHPARSTQRQLAPHTFNPWGEPTGDVRQAADRSGRRTHRATAPATQRKTARDPGTRTR